MKRFSAIAAVLAVAALARSYQLGRLSYWYDEVVTLRLARADGPSALLDLLGKIDATRAPLHPLVLQAWVKAFGPSEASGRAFSRPAPTPVRPSVLSGRAFALP